MMPSLELLSRQDMMGSRPPIGSRSVIANLGYVDLAGDHDRASNDRQQPIQDPGSVWY
jgi:hypothetical protein